MRNSCVRCGRVFVSNISLDKHARHCKKPTTEARRSRKRARVDEPDNLFAEPDIGDHNILDSDSSAHNVSTLLRGPVCSV